jgi:hypothetical protein
MLRASGQLTAPVLLTFDQLSASSQPDLLLWPVGGQVNLSAQCDITGNVTISGGPRFLDVFARLVDSHSKATVKLTLATQAGDCSTNVPVVGGSYVLGCVINNRLHAQESMALVQVEIAAVNAFQKIFQINHKIGDQSPFWQGLDEQCQMLTQGRLGVTGYDFSGTDESREIVRQAVLADIVAAPKMSPETKKLVENTLTSSNLSVMANLPNRLAWDKSLRQITAELTAQNNKARSAMASGIPAVTGQFNYFSPDQIGAGNQISLARLDFATRQQATYDQQMAQLNVAIAELEKKLFTPGLSLTARSQIRSQIKALEERKQSLFLSSGFTP